MNKIIIKKNHQGFNDIAEDWNQLSNKQGHHFTHSPFWYQANIEHYPEYATDCFFVCGYNEQNLIFVIPLEKKYISNKKLGFFYLQLFYPNEMGVCDITCMKGLNIDWQKVINIIKAEFPTCLYLRLQSILDDSDAEKSKLSKLSSHQKISHKPCYLDFQQGYDEFMGRYSSKFKRNLRRLHKKASAQGELTLNCVTKAEDLESAFEAFLDSEDSGWKGKAGSSVKKLKQLNNYYRHFLKTYGKTGDCQINLLSIGDEVIASQFCLKSQKTLYLLKIGYNDNYTDLSPGQLLIEQLVKKGEETKQFNRIHFVTDYQWMYRWKPDSQNALIAYIPTNLGGHLITTGLKLKIAINNLKAKLKKKATQKKLSE